MSFKTEMRAVRRYVFAMAMNNNKCYEQRAVMLDCLEKSASQLRESINEMDPDDCPFMVCDEHFSLGKSVDLDKLIEENSTM